MKKIIENIRKDKVIHYIIIIAASLIAAIPLINLRIYGTDDGYVHMLRIFGMEQILKEQNFPPFIYSKFANGFGYAINLFYSPIVTYGPLFFRIFGLHYYTCLKLFAYSTILISCFTMYNFLYEVSKKREIAILGALIYAFIPYRLETIFNRFAIGEFTAYIFFPMLFHGLFNLLKGDGKKHYYIAIAAIGLILTHTISTEYSAIFALLYIVFNFKQLKNKGVIRKIAINVIFILAITTFFTVPLMEHKILGNYVIFNSKSMKSLPSDVQNSTIKISQLFKDIGEVNGVSFKVGIPLIILMLLGIVSYKKMDKNIKSEYITFAVIAMISLAMVTKLFPWIIMPKILTTLQFAWRMLAFFEFALSIICAINLYYFIDIICKKSSKNSKDTKVHTKTENLYNMLLLFAIIVIITSMMKIDYNYSYEKEKFLTDEEYETKINEKNSIWSINREYLPEKVDVKKLGTSYLDYRENRVYVLDGNSTITNEKKKGLQLEFDIENYKANTILELPYTYYLGYTVTTEQNEKIQMFESDNGMLAIKLDENIESAHITVKYTGTIIEKVSYLISAISVITFVGYVIHSKKQDI
ncbi:MAG: hypothetical protein ACLS9A_03905 [Clostridia bacterium]